MTDHGYTVKIPLGYDEAVLQARLAFRGEGFSILSEMHVGGMLGPEAGDERQYLIMGIWNAPVSDQRMGKDLVVGVHLPCNLVVQETGETAMVAALDPLDALEPQEPVATEVTEAARAALERVLHKIGSIAS
jgi:uncharacterized protein (DUF302 family)